MIITSVHMSKILLVVGLVAISLFRPEASRAAPFLTPVSITVYATYGIGPLHTTPIGAGILMDAVVSLEYGDFPHRVDLYVGAILPDGRFASWVGDPAQPSLATGGTPQPFLVNVIPAEASYSLTVQQFSGGDPTGWYTLYGIIVPAGAPPLDPGRWLSTSFSPLLVTPPLF